VGFAFGERAVSMSGVITPIPLLSSRELVDAGQSAHRLERRTRTGELIRLRPGIYADAGEWERLSALQQHEARMRAHRMLHPDAVFMRESAAVAHRIPLFGELDPRPQVLVVPDGTRSTAWTRTVERGGPTPTVTTSGGFRSADAAETVIELAASGSLLRGIVAIDHARGSLGIGLDRLEAAVGSRRPFRGVRRVDLALARSTGRSESPLESLVMVRCRDLGFAAPEQQTEIGVNGRRYRVDFSWDDGRIVLEADGRTKYLELAGDRSAAEVVLAEKAREDEIRTVVRRFGRVDWSSALRGGPLESVLLRLGVPRIRSRTALTR